MRACPPPYTRKRWQSGFLVAAMMEEADAVALPVVAAAPAVAVADPDVKTTVGQPPNEALALAVALALADALALPLADALPLALLDAVALALADAAALALADALALPVANALHCVPKQKQKQSDPVARQ